MLLRKSRILNFRALLLITGVLLTSGCEMNSADPRLAIAWSNMAISYPIWAALTSTKEGQSRIITVDVVTGEQRELHEKDGMQFNGIQSVPQRVGEFIVSINGAQEARVERLNIATGSSTLLWAVKEKVLHAPFMLGSTVCALTPDSSTSKQSYNYSVLCNSGDNYSSITIYDYDEYTFNKNNAIFINSEQGNNIIYIIENNSGKIEINYIEINGINYLKILGSYDGRPYFYSTESGGGVTVYSLDNNELVAENDKIAKVISAARSHYDQKFFPAGPDDILATQRSEDNRDIVGSIWGQAGKVYEHMLSLDAH